MLLTKTICRYCKNGGCYGGPYAPRPARCGDCNGTGHIYEDEEGNQYHSGSELATDGEEYFETDDCKDWDGSDGTGPNGQHVWMTELECGA